MKKYLILLAFVSAPLFAGMPSEPPKPEPPVVTPDPPPSIDVRNDNSNNNSNSNSNSNSQGQHQGQTSDNTNTSHARSGDSTATGGSVGDVGATGGSVGDLSSTSTAGASVGDTASHATVGDTHASGGAATAEGGSVGDTASTATAAGGNVGTVAARSGDSRSSSDANSGGNTIDASNRSTYRAVYIPTVTQPSLPAVVPGGNVSVQVGACQAQVEVQSAPVNGTFFGLTRRSKVEQGMTDILVPARAPYAYVALPDGSTQVNGHQVTTYATVLTVSGSRNLQLGGGGSNGSWAQGGGGVSSAMQQLVLRHVVQQCTIGIIPVTLPIVEGECNGPLCG